MEVLYKGVCAKCNEIRPAMFDNLKQWSGEELVMINCEGQNKLVQIKELEADNGEN